MLLNWIQYYSKVLFTIKNFLLVISAFILNFFLVFTTYRDFLPIEKVKAISNMFYFPININLDLFRWILLFLPFLLIVNSFLNRAFTESPVYFFIRTRKLKYWFHSLFIVAGLFVLISMLLGFVITGLLVYLAPFGTEPKSQLLGNLSINDSWLFNLNAFLIFVLVTCLLIIMNLLLSFIIKNELVSFLWTLILMVLGVFLGNIYPSILEWYPYAYGLFAFQNFSQVPFFWYYLSLLLYLIITYLVAFMIFEKNRERILKFL